MSSRGNSQQNKGGGSGKSNDCNVDNRTFFCHDNLEVLQGINSECIDLIYLDPPFNKNKEFATPLKKSDAKEASAKGASFRDIFREEDIKEEWLYDIKEMGEKYGNKGEGEKYKKLATFLECIKTIDSKLSYNYCYLVYMAIRLIECHRVLKNTGSIYLHCDPTMSHYLKLVLDLIFGEKNFKNEIVWKKTNSPKSQSKTFGEQHDIILFYSKSKEFNFFQIYTAFNEKYLKAFSKDDKDGRGPYQTVAIVAGGLQKYEGRKEFEFQGITACWLYKKEILEQWWAEGRIYISKNGNYRKKDYLKDRVGIIVSDLFVDDEVKPFQGNSKENANYPTQKPLALLERIIQASSIANKERQDIVLDPFCGCATTCIAAEALERRWIGIDVSMEARDLIRDRLKEVVANPQDLIKRQNKIITYTDPPDRDDQGKNYVEKKWVYVISNPKFNNKRYKVGITDNLPSRLGSFNTGDPDRNFEIEFSVEKENFRETERYIHNKYPSNHEWVTGNLEDIKRDIEEYKGRNMKQVRLDLQNLSQPNLI